MTVSRRFDAPIPDMQTVSFALEVADDMPVESLSISVDIRHTYIGDLIIFLLPPAGTGVSTIVLYSRAGGSTKNLQQTFDAFTTPALAKFSGKKCKGIWTLQIQDVAAQDFGTLVSFGMSLSFPRSDRMVQTPDTKKPKKISSKIAK